MTLAKAVRHRIHSIAFHKCVHQSTLLPSHKHIAEFVTRDLHPISVVDGQGFTRLVYLLYSFDSTVILSKAATNVGFLHLDILNIKQTDNCRINTAPPTKF